MKKIITIGSLCLISSALLTGCATNQDAATTNLLNQIDLLNNTVDSVSRSQQEIPSISSLTKQQAISYSGIFQSTKDILQNHNGYKTTILTKTALIKNKIATGLKLNKQSAKALSDLTSTLAKDTKKLNETKADFKGNINEVKKIVTNDKATTSQISAKINKLSNCMDLQECFYKNLINTLNNIEKILEINDDSFDYSKINDLNYQENYKNVKTDNSNDYKELFYQYLLSQQTNKDCENCDSKKDETKEENIYINQTPPYYGNANQPFYNGYGNNGLYGYYYGYGYGPMTNPTRNTDSFRPWAYNIDTYKLPANQLKNARRNITPNQTIPQGVPVTTENKNKEILEDNDNKIEIEKSVQQEEKINTSLNKGKMVNEKTFPLNNLDINKKIEDLIKSKKNLG